jgi:hypothetical protein
VKSLATTDVVWFPPLWLAVLTAASAGLTTAFTCITPFAAFAVIAATTLSPRQALACTGGIWLANQVIGFGVLNYPWTAGTLAWGVAIGVSAVAATLIAQWTVRWLASLRATFKALGAFVSAFVCYQMALYAVAASALGGTAAFTPRIVAQVLLVNAVTLLGLAGLHQLVVVMASLARQRRPHQSPVRVDDPGPVRGHR